MENSHVRAIACAAAVACALAAVDADACTSDVDCKGARICQAGKCTSPEPEPKASPKKKAETTKAKKAKEPAKKKEPSPPPKPPEPEPVEEAPAPVIEEPAAKPTVAKPAAKTNVPWAGATESVRGTINLVGGYGVRAADNVYFGAGFGLQAGVVSGGGVYFGIRAHEHLTNTKQFADAFSWAKAEGRTSWYAIELGYDAAASSRVVVRTLLGLGVLRAQGKVTGEVLGSPVEVRHDETTVGVEPSIAVWVRVSPSWFLGPQAGVLMGFEEGPAIGAGNLTLGLGRVW